MSKRIDFSTPTTEQLDEIEFLAARMGHDGAAKRAAAAKLNADKVAEVIQASIRWCGRNGIDLRVDTSGQPATEPQVAYIAKLLIQRDIESGFSGLVAGLVDGGHPNTAAIQRLTKAQASQVIDSLTEQY